MGDPRSDWKKPNHYSFRNFDDQCTEANTPDDRTATKLHSQRLNRCNTYRTNRKYSIPLKYISNGVFWDIRRQFWMKEDCSDSDDDETIADVITPRSHSPTRSLSHGLYVPAWRPELANTDKPIPVSCYPHKKPTDGTKIKKKKPSRVWDECDTPNIKQSRQSMGLKSANTNKTEELRKISELRKRSEQRNWEKKHSKHWNLAVRDSDQRYFEQKDSELRKSEQRKSKQKKSEQRKLEQRKSEQKKSEQRSSEQRSSEQRNSEQRYSESGYSEQRYLEDEKSSKSNKMQSQMGGRGPSFTNTKTLKPLFVNEAETLPLVV